MSRNSSRRRSIQKRSNPLNYESLERREVLTGFHQVDMALPDGINLIQNGDFSQFSGSTTNYFDADQVPGWQVISSTPPRVNQIKLLPYQELGRVLDLDSSARSFDKVFQEIETLAGRKYLLSFDFMAHPRIATESPALDSDTANFELYWNNELVRTLRPGQHWATFSIEVTGSADGTSHLQFAELPTGTFGGGDGAGVLINNVRLVRAVESQVSNSGFENLGTDSQVSGDLYRAGLIPNWGAGGVTQEQRYMRLETPNPSDVLFGSKVLNLNASDSYRDFVVQQLQTTTEAVYYVQFQAKGNFTNQMRMRWNNAWALTIRPGTEYATYGVLVKATGTQTKLEFVEGIQNDGDLWIDNVKLYRIDPAGVNTAPSILQVQSQNADFGVLQSYQMNATDSEANPVTWSVTPSGIGSGHNVPTISSNGVIQWTPSQAGVVDLTVRATDSLGASSDMTFTVTVAGFVPLSGNRTLSNVPAQFRNGIYSSAAASWANNRPPMTINTSKQYTAVFETSAGEIRIQLYPQQAPITVNTFFRLSEDGYYDGLEFHRVIEDFMAQGGDPLGTGTGGPGFQFIDEIDSSLVFNRSGLLAMANAGAGTNGSQFFVTFGATPWLNGNHTIFGEVVSGQNILDSIVRTHQADNQPISGNIVRTRINSLVVLES